LPPHLFFLTEGEKIVGLETQTIGLFAGRGKEEHRFLEMRINVPGWPGKSSGRLVGGFGAIGDLCRAGLADRSNNSLRSSPSREF
jgi:hypothetical protein